MSVTFAEGFAGAGSVMFGQLISAPPAPVEALVLEAVDAPPVPADVLDCALAEDALVADALVDDADELDVLPPPVPFELLPHALSVDATTIAGKASQSAARLELTFDAEDLRFKGKRMNARNHEALPTTRENTAASEVRSHFARVGV